MTDPSSSRAYLVAEMEVRDPEALRRYARAVVPVMERHGGSILATSTHNARVVEGEDRQRLLAVHRWRSQRDFDTFFSSPEYAPLKQVRHDACQTRIVIFDAPPAATLLPVLQGRPADAAVADEVRFLSPVTEYQGRDDVLHIVTTIASVVRDIAVTSVLDDGPSRVTRFTARIGENRADGVLHEHSDQLGRIDEAELYLRPYAALRDGVAQMKARLERDPLPSAGDPQRRRTPPDY